MKKLTTDNLLTYFNEAELERYWKTAEDRLDDDLKDFSVQEWKDDFFQSLYWSYSSVICNHFEENEAYYSQFFKNGETVDQYGDRFLLQDGEIAPFIQQMPEELEQFLNQIAIQLIDYTNKQLKD